ncbi:hypothetical protein M405DRAFT_828143 [Rhizopogon salebrosus TDB-379]|nr:hypothetical protein M405DRAFT_828143 [Rhizopogon salebrosus TDB-379]
MWSLPQTPLVGRILCALVIPLSGKRAHLIKSTPQARSLCTSCIQLSLTGTCKQRTNRTRTARERERESRD